MKMPAGLVFLEAIGGAAAGAPVRRGGPAWGAHEGMPYYSGIAQQHSRGRWQRWALRCHICRQGLLQHNTSVSKMRLRLEYS